MEILIQMISKKTQNSPLHNFLLTLGVEVKNTQIFDEVFTHRSYLNEHKSVAHNHNERLEFLGDAVLELVVTEHLYKTYPNPEGELTNWRSAIVKGEMISQVSRQLNLGSFLKMSKGEEQSGGKERNLILANLFEALIGGIYLDEGYAKESQFIHTYLIPKLKKIIEEGTYIDSKSRFQELIQNKIGFTPRYELIDQDGPDHNRMFTIGVYIEEKCVGKGQGPSKQKAEQAAAADALTYYL